MDRPATLIAALGCAQDGLDDEAPLAALDRDYFDCNIAPILIEGCGTLGITAGASAPELLVDEVIKAFADRFAAEVETVETTQEDVVFKLPRALREAAHLED